MKNVHRNVFKWAKKLREEGKSKVVQNCKHKLRKERDEFEVSKTDLTMFICNTIKILNTCTGEHYLAAAYLIEVCDCV